MLHLGSEVAMPQVVAVRGDSLEECIDRMNTELRYSRAVMVTAVEYTADEDSLIVLATIIVAGE